MTGLGKTPDGRARFNKLDSLLLLFENDTPCIEVHLQG